MKERIQKVLANFGVDSRRNIETMILQGRVTVNGKVVTKLPILIDPDHDHVSVDDEPVRLAAGRRGKKPVERMYFLLNKPRDVYCTNVAQGEQRLARDLLPPNLPGRLYPVGRLDADSKGLLLMTNDGDLTNLLTHPRYEVPKTYRATIDGHVSDDTIKKLQKGIWLADKEGQGFKTGTSKIKIIHRSNRNTILEITIREGRNRQVRRMLAKMDHKVRELIRIKMGPLTLEGVGPGKYRPLTPREVKLLYGLAKEGERKLAAKAPAPKKPSFRSATKPADPEEDMAVEFEDEELLREARAERGGVETTDDETKVEADEVDGEEGDVEFVDLSEEEQAELEAEAKAATQRRKDDDDDDLPE